MTERDVFESLFLAKSFYIPFYFYGIIKTTADTLHLNNLETRSSIINKSYDFLKTKTWFNEHKEECEEHYFSAIKEKTHYGWNMSSDSMMFYPEFAISHVHYINNSIHEVLKERFENYNDLIDIDCNSLWKNKKENIQLEIKTFLPGTWTFEDTREFNIDSYYNTLYIKGRFDNSWKKQNIKRIL
jgi:hypothetical protein